ncbi:MAG: hypothetical protein ACTID1_00305 [Pseudolactococcus laudensis]
MKFIINLYLYLIGVVTILAIGALFESNESVLAWVVLIGFGIVYAFINDRNEGKHDE